VEESLMMCKNIVTESGKNITIYDDVFTFAERQEFYSFCKNSFYRIDGKDSDIIEHQSNLSLVARYTENDLFNMKFLECIKDEKILDVTKKYKLNSASVNLSTPADLYHVHTDTHAKEGMTILYYVNMSWSIDWAGETIFLNEKGDDFEYVSAFKPGRLLLFDATIPHMIRPPVMKANTLRMTLALRYCK
jgi:Rps23 Pro-64 3,4-dihydroxylase Tpa1-like proline 4-hydroxylase